MTLSRAVLQRRLSSREIVVSLPAGVELYCPPTLGCNRTIAIGLEHYEEQSFLLDVVRPGDIALDVGAFLGTFSLLMASRGALVHAFEPAPLTAKALRRNIERNGFGEQIRLYERALSDFAGTVSFTTGHGSGNRIIDEREPDADAVTEVPVTTIDEWSRDRDLSGLLLIKIDAEGADDRVLRGAEAVRAEFDPALIVEYWSSDARVLDRLRDEGYSLYRYDRPTCRLVPATPRLGFGNVIACRHARYHDLRARLSNGARLPLSSPRVRWRSD